MQRRYCQNYQFLRLIYTEQRRKETKAKIFFNVCLFSLLIFFICSLIFFAFAGGEQALKLTVYQIFCDVANNIDGKHQKKTFLQIT